VKKLHNEELRDSTPSIIRIIKSRRMRWEGHVARMGENRNTFRLLVGKPEGKGPPGRPRRRWVDNIRMERENGVIWTGLVWLRIGTGRESSCGCGNEPSGFHKMPRNNRVVTQLVASRIVLILFDMVHP
jgi:hypothetical protein